MTNNERSDRLSPKTTGKVLKAGEIGIPERRDIKRTLARVVAVVGLFAVGAAFIRFEPLVTTPPSTEVKLETPVGIDNQTAAEDILKALRNPNGDTRPIMTELAAAETAEYGQTSSGGLQGGLPLDHLKLPGVKLDPSRTYSGPNITIHPES